MKKKNDEVAAPAAESARLLGVKAAAQFLGATVWFTRGLAWAGTVPHVVFGKRILFDRKDLERFIETSKVGGR